MLADQGGLGEQGEIRSRALRGVVSVAFRGVGIRLLGLLGYLVTARLLTPKDFGVAALGLSITATAHFIADAGIGAALLRSPDPPDRRTYAAVVGLQVTVLGAAAALCVAWAVLTGSRTAIVTAIFVSSVPLLSFRLPAAISLERELQFGPSVRADLIEVLVYTVWIVGGALAGWGVFALATGTMVKTVVGTSVLTRRAPIGFVGPSLEFGRLKGLLRFGVTYQATSAVTLARDQVINAGAVAIAGYGVLGLWAIAGKVTSVPLLVFESMMRVSFPTMSRLRALGADLAEPMERQTRRSTVLTGAVLAPSAVAGPLLLPVLLGHTWDEAADVLPYVFLGMMISQPISVIASGFLLAAGDAKAVFRVGLIISITQVAVTAVALPTIGYVGMGLGLAVAAVADGIVLARAVHGHNGARLLRCIVPGSVAFVPAVAGGLLLGAGHPNVLVGSAAVAVSAGTFAALAYLLDREAVIGLLSVVRELPSHFRSPVAVADPVADATPLV